MTSSEIKVLELTCDSCDATAKSVGEAAAHVSENVGHEMTGAGPLEDSTFTISVVPVDDDDDDDDDDDWNAGDQ